MTIIQIDKSLLVSAIAGNTDASEHDARSIVNIVLYRQRVKHKGEECETDSIAAEVCEAMYLEKVDDILELCEALRAVKTLCGELPQIRLIVDDALREHGDE